MDNTLNDYQEAALRTAKVFPATTFTPLQMDMLHAALGVGSDAGELQDAIKKHLIYGKPLDRANVIEEIGDVMWFLCLMCRAIDISLEDIAQANIAKLILRYPEKYSDEAAIARGDKTMETLEEVFPGLTEAAKWATANPAAVSDVDAVAKQLGISDGESNG
jgi:NTP pyrophosphatase (non-canonical NTP hydrolase)